MLGSLLFLNY
ncbi:hypothetical protein MIMGU_mgv1a0201932mg, partial [Erythranthe guttata]